MIERNQNIFADVKLQIGRSPNNNQMFRAINRVQNEIFTTGDIERSFDIILEKGVSAYNFIEQGCLVIIKLFTSWKNGRIDWKPNTKWDEYKDLTGAFPSYATIFARELYLAPVPIRSDDKITIWGYQTKLDTKMDDEVPPELDEAFDHIMMWGTCAQFDTSFNDKYITERDKMLNNLNIKKQSIEDPEWAW